MTTAPPRDNIKGGAWLIADISLNIWALSIVKWLGPDYPAVQIVFFRAVSGFVLILPLIWTGRAHFRAIDDILLHLLRVAFAVVALAASFFAIARVPLALVTAIGFTRPVVTMVMAAMILRETIGAKRWVAAGLALIGVLIAVNPTVASWSPGHLAMVIVVFTGSGAIIVTRRLRASPPIVMMTFYTVGLALGGAPFAIWFWVPVATQDLWLIIAVGAFAQCAQLCFLRAHYHGEAGFLSVLSYLSLIFSVGAGYFVFDETPDALFFLGAGVVILATLWVSLDPRAVRTRA